MPKKKTAQARIDEDLREDFDWALQLTGLGETQFIEAAIRALVEKVKDEGGIWLPLAIVPKPPKKTVPTSGATAPAGSDSARFSVNEDSPAVPKTSAGPRTRSTKPGIATTLSPKKGKSGS